VKSERKGAVVGALSYVQVLAVGLAIGWATTSGASAPVVQLRDTYYYVVPEREYASLPKDATLLDLAGGVIAQVSRAFKEAADIEGSARLIDGRIVNYAGMVVARGRREVRWRFVDAPYGLGVGDCELEPFRSAAIDSKVVPVGSLIKIEETVGMALPDGKIHDGYWRAEDIGGAIHGARIDLFVGDGDEGGDVLRAHHIKHMQPLHVEIVSPPAADSCVYKKRRP
jgi:3D (Asp-Asp-Asp) domain-containing protein